MYTYITQSRKNMKHNENFEYDLKVGKRGEKIVWGVLEDDRTEVKSEQTKTARNWTNTDNCFVEYESRDKKSGLAHTKAEWWVINFMQDDKLCFCVWLSVERMKKIARRYYREEGRRVLGGDNNTSKGVLVPISALLDPNSHIMPETPIESGMRIAEEIRKNEQEHKDFEERIKKNAEKTK